MLKIKEYVKAESLEQAYELNQKRTNCILGGMLWLKMSNRNVQKAIDLSGLGLNQIEETEEEFRSLIDWCSSVFLYQLFGYSGSGNVFFLRKHLSEDQTDEWSAVEDLPEESNREVHECCLEPD